VPGRSHLLLLVQAVAQRSAQSAPQACPRSPGRDGQARLHPGAAEAIRRRQLGEPRSHRGLGARL